MLVLRNVKMYINGKYHINIHRHDLFTNIYIQFGSQCFKRKSFISFTIRKIIYDTISQWHPKWNQKNTYKIMQEKIFAKYINVLKDCHQIIFLNF